MSYERLTEHKKLCGMDYIKLKDCDKYDCEQCITPCEGAKERLAELEDKIERGTLVELPCKVGDMVYIVYSSFGDFDEWEVTSVELSETGYILRLGHKGTDDYSAILQKEIGDYAFFSKAEAEEKLRELRGEKD